MENARRIQTSPLRRINANPSGARHGTAMESRQVRPNLPPLWIVRVVQAGVLFAAASLAAPAFASGSVIHAGKSWAAIDRGAVCEAQARAIRIAEKGRVQAIAGFAFSADRKRWGEFHARLSKVPRPGSSVMLTVGTQQFLLVPRGLWAWSRGPLQEQAIIEAARAAGAMRIDGREASGRRFTDRYLLAGAPTAIDAAAARCAGKIARE